MYRLGASTAAVHHLFSTLRPLLPTYAIKPVNADIILNEPWQSSASLLIFPGGRDQPFASALQGQANRLIKDYVNGGGNFLGLCAGGYYGCSAIEFEVDNPAYRVVEKRELGFFKGICRGGAFHGFKYDDESGVKAANVSSYFNGKEELSTIYWNGGGVFVDAASIDGVVVLAKYLDSIDVEGGNAAVVKINVGNGTVILSGRNLTQNAELDGHKEIIAQLIEADTSRDRFMRNILAQFSLRVSHLTAVLPPISPIYLASTYENLTTAIVNRFKQQSDQKFEIHDKNDKFVLCEQDLFNMTELTSTLPDQDLNDIPKQLIPAFKYPDIPGFSLPLYFHALKNLQRPGQTFGQTVLYSNIVSSTQTILEKYTTLAVQKTNFRNKKFCSLFDSGTPFIASHQLLGRGRGTNAWVSPPGVLAQSFILHHDPSKASIVPIQYLVSLAMVESILFQKDDYDVRLKWPNDIYAANGREYTKIGGVLVNANFNGKLFELVIGCGTNVYKNEGLYSLNSLLQSHNEKRTRMGKEEYPEYQIETLLARFFTIFEEMYEIFITKGSFQLFQQQYYRRWLHSGQLVSVEGVRAEILGITDDGLLSCEEVDETSRRIGRKWALQPDGNSFDMLKGLIRRKM
ncbi:Biotin--protein ligase [Neolecta irregularis DAH-3]|uniref:Biotin--protein ligase n=1 Tax=Neolecta irregularis (strain DAH-3) TaxID=1198029 RepID=A0A1U7LG78_NEOID|nr:Biotin--protein ligase [Neolecta irregularis DAH-3]|eukprot:OLL21649.1 Biotin--protein ligase [Neolecta irregularis DAH-3]